MANWRVHKVATFLVLGLIAAGLLNVVINLEDKVLGLISWKIVLLIGTAYVAWVFATMLHT